MVSVEVAYDFEAISKTDEIEDGIDYRKIVTFIREFSQTYDGKTLECFAQCLAREIKNHFHVQKVRLSVDKPRYVQKLGLRQITVEVEY